MDLVRRSGYGIGNVDVTVVAQEPKLAPYVQRMRTSLAGVLAVAPEQINIKSTTTEGLGFAGRGEGIAAYAVALLVKT
jgi:2-C-methyl-D-erythritol 2,4-cyclodiphosphate synthase